MKIDRLQGTDGVRGPICFSEYSSNTDPISSLLNEGVLTEDFFELYTYAYCTELLQKNFASRNDKVVIGKDSRDITGQFYKAAVQGIRKSGMQAISIDVLPTPAISLYQLHVEAACGFVLTASHNSADQNGIKIFLGYSNLKLFPEDDIRLTQRCLSLDFEKLKNAPLIGEQIDEHNEAKKLFKNFVLESNNHWMEQDTLNDTIIIIDCANGAFSSLIKDLTSNISGEFFLTNTDPNNGINSFSGVADIEGIDYISSEDIENGIFCNYEAIKKVLFKGRLQNDKSGKLGMTFGFVFDGDGDRCFLLIYNPVQDGVLILDGDILSFFQAKLLNLKSHSIKKQLFVDTIESDIELERAVKEIGYNALQCAVGDKWILWNAFFYDWQTKLEFYKKTIEDSEFSNLLKEVNSDIRLMVLSSKFDALYVTSKLKAVDSWISENIDKQIVLDASDYCSKRSNSYFAIGSEVSGHVITLGEMSCGNTKKSVFIGNSIKCAFNSVAAIKSICKSENINDLIDMIKNPFTRGYKKSLQVYYVDKSLLSKKSSTRGRLEKLLLTYTENWFGIESKIESHPEEPDLIILRVIEGNSYVASVFVRNSGTEDKVVVYFRGIRKLSSNLDELASNVNNFLMNYFKNIDNPMAQAEKFVLKRLSTGPKSKTELITKKFSKLPYDRLLNEMCSRQKLIYKDGEDWSITNLGFKLLNFSERSE